MTPTQTTQERAQTPIKIDVKTLDGLRQFCQEFAWALQGYSSEKLYVKEAIEDANEIALDALKKIEHAIELDSRSKP